MVVVVGSTSKQAGRSRYAVCQEKVKTEPDPESTVQTHTHTHTCVTGHTDSTEYVLLSLTQL